MRSIPISGKQILSEAARPKVFLRKGVLKICIKFTGEHPFRHGCSSENLPHISGTSFYKNNYGGLLLFFEISQLSGTCIIKV